MKMKYLHEVSPLEYRNILLPVKCTKSQKKLLETFNIITSKEFGEPTYIIGKGNVIKTFDWKIFYITSDYTLIPSEVLDFMFSISEVEKAKIYEGHSYNHFHNAL